MMKYEHALALFETMQRHQRQSVLLVFDGIKSSFNDVRDAFSQAVADEALVIEVETLLLWQQETGAMQ